MDQANSAAGKPLACPWRPGILAGAGGFEPPPSSLTVRCPTGWTTPQRAAIPDSGRASGWARPREKRARLNLKIPRMRRGARASREKIGATIDNQSLARHRKPIEHKNFWERLRFFLDATCAAPSNGESNL